MEVGKREITYLSLHCHHQHDPCIKMASDESHFNVPVVRRDKVTRQCSQTTTFEEKESQIGFEPRGSDERHFNVPVILSDKVTRQCPQTTTRKKSRIGFEPRGRNRPRNP